MTRTFLEKIDNDGHAEIYEKVEFSLIFKGNLNYEKLNPLICWHPTDKVI